MWFHVIHSVMILLIIAFFVLFAASKADGLVKLLGMVIGLLLLIGAVLHLVFGIMAMNGSKPFGMDLHGGWMHHGWMHHDGDQNGPGMMGQPPAQPQQPTPPPAAPAAH
jgi:hypothetical protein